MFEQAQQFIKCPVCKQVGGYTDADIPGYGKLEDDYLNAETGGEIHREPYNAECPYCGAIFTMTMVYKFQYYAISHNGSFESYSERKLEAMKRKQERASR